MKKLFIQTKIKGTISLRKTDLIDFPRRIGLVTTAQHLDMIEPAINALQEAGKTAKIKPNPKTGNNGEILGCSYPKMGVDAYLYIGTGSFHPKIIVLSEDKPVITLNPLTGKIGKIEKKDVEELEKKRKGSLLKFYSSDKIGIIVSVKPGQENLKKVEMVKKKYPDKQFFTFLCDNLDFSELENFNFVECWVNTACPRIGMDDTIRTRKVIVNADDLL